MNQTQAVELDNGTLVLDAATLRAAQIEHRARIIVQEHAILILPALDAQADPVASTFGLIQLPPDLAREIAESKELEYET